MATLNKEAGEMTIGQFIGLLADIGKLHDFDMPVADVVNWEVHIEHRDKGKVLCIKVTPEHSLWSNPGDFLVYSGA